MLNLASFGLGLCAWGLGALAVQKHGGIFSLGSMSCCALALVLELFEVCRRVALGDWSALMDTIPAVTLAATVLVTVTILLNLLAMRKER